VCGIVLIDRHHLALGQHNAAELESVREAENIIIRKETEYYRTQMAGFQIINLWLRKLVWGGTQLPSRQFYLVQQGSRETLRVMGRHHSPLQFGGMGVFQAWGDGFRNQFDSDLTVTAQRGCFPGRYNVNCGLHNLTKSNNVRLKRRYYDVYPRSLLLPSCVSSNFELPLKNEGRPEGGDSNSDSQHSHYPVSYLRFFVWSIPPVEQPMVSSVHELTWGWWVWFIGGIVIVEIGALLVWGCAHMIDEGMPVRVGLLLIGFSLAFLTLGAAMLHHAFLEANALSRESVTQKDLTTRTYCNTVSPIMANVLSAEKQTAIIAALAEGSSIRSIERITGVHRDTIMRLGVRVGKGCQMLMDSKMQDLDCHYLQFDELWGFIGKKERHCSVDDNPTLGDVWTFCAIDSETKLVPSFKVGKRTHATTTEFVQDVASRMRNRVQISSDAMHLYVEAMELAFGSDVDYGQCVKVYTHDAAQHPERKYSAPHFASAYRRPITGNPEMELVSTSHVERLNATTRLHMRRLTRLTLAFSKKLENFEAAVGLHFAYYNFVKRHNTLRCTPAMAAGIERDFWSVGDLVEAAA
jgi:IS1 family transposase